VWKGKEFDARLSLVVPFHHHRHRHRHRHQGFASMKRQLVSLVMLLVILVVSVIANVNISCEHPGNAPGVGSRYTCYRLLLPNCFVAKTDDQTYSFTHCHVRP
jgi:ABC-type microcin C transport system permease subunit YejE